MNPKAVIRSKEIKETNIYEFMYRTIEGTLIIVNEGVEDISLSMECVEKTGQREAVCRTLDGVSLADAKNLYLVLRSMLNVTGDLEELDECIL